MRPIEVYIIVHLYYNMFGDQPSNQEIKFVATSMRDSEREKWNKAEHESVVSEELILELKDAVAEFVADRELSYTYFPKLDRYETVEIDGEKVFTAINESEQLSVHERDELIQQAEDLAKKHKVLLEPIGTHNMGRIRMTKIIT